MSGRLVVRELRTPEEFIETAHVSKAAWGFAERSLSPASDLVAATHAGGLTAAAFEGGKMLGFVHGIPRTNLGEPCQHSHLLAVRPDAQGRGLGAMLKLFQRAWCLERGIRLVTWTYDPFLLKNAKLNIERLRATVQSLLPDFYGHMGGIYAGLPTDRFEVNWRLDDPRVERAARGDEGPPDDTTGVPAVTRPGAIPVATRLLLPFLADAPRVYRTDPKRSLAARRKFRRLATELFAKGYEVTGVTVRDGEPAYVLDRTGDRVFDQEDEHEKDSSSVGARRFPVARSRFRTGGRRRLPGDGQRHGEDSRLHHGHEGQGALPDRDRKGHEDYRRRQGRRQGHDQVQDARELDRGEGSGGQEGSQAGEDEVRMPTRA